jgi:hypothetical protein
MPNNFSVPAGISHLHQQPQHSFSTRTLSSAQLVKPAASTVAADAVASVSPALPLVVNRSAMKLVGLAQPALALGVATSDILATTSQLFAYRLLSISIRPVVLDLLCL